MIRSNRPGLGWWCLVALVAGGCGGSSAAGAGRPTPASAGGVLEPADALEREALSQLDDLPADSARGGVLAGAPYAAASGRTCRPVQLTAAGGATRARLACRDERSWFYVPAPVLSASPASDPVPAAPQTASATGAAP